MLTTSEPKYFLLFFLSTAFPTCTSQFIWKFTGGCSANKQQKKGVRLNTMLPRSIYLPLSHVFCAPHMSFSSIVLFGVHSLFDNQQKKKFG